MCVRTCEKTKIFSQGNMGRVGICHKRNSLFKTSLSLSLSNFSALSLSFKAHFSAPLSMSLSLTIPEVSYVQTLCAAQAKETDLKKDAARSAFVFKLSAC